MAPFTLSIFHLWAMARSRIAVEELINADEVIVDCRLVMSGANPSSWLAPRSWVSVLRASTPASTQDRPGRPWPVSGPQNNGPPADSAARGANTGGSRSPIPDPPIPPSPALFSRRPRRSLHFLGVIDLFPTRQPPCTPARTRNNPDATNPKATLHDHHALFRLGVDP